MKSVLQAAWLLTVAFGNLIVAVIANMKLFNEQSYVYPIHSFFIFVFTSWIIFLPPSKEFFFFATLMAVDISIFAVMAYFYTAVKVEAEDANGTSGAIGDGHSVSNGRSKSHMQMEPMNGKSKIKSELSE